MANEISVTGKLSVTKDGFTVTGNITKTISMSGSQYTGLIQTVGTSYETMSIGDCSNVRYFFLCNTNESASVFLSQNIASQSFALLRPDDVVLVTPSGSIAEYFLKSTHANTDLQVVAVEE